MNLRNSAALAAAFASAGLCAANPLDLGGAFEATTRFFTGSESRAYSSFQYKTTLANKTGVRLAGSIAAIRRTSAGYGVLLTGGKELEAGFERTITILQPIDGKGITLHVYGGLTVADTAAFTGTAFTYEALAGMTELPFRVGLCGITGDGLQMGLVGLDADYAAPVGTSLNAFVGAPLWGENTRSTDDGSLMRRAVWRLETGRKVKISGLSWEFKVFLGNQLGLTTGLKMTPALGNQVGFGISAGVRF